jgi:hypothetical protein
MSQHTSEDGLLLPGLDGTNPLGFLAVLGVLRILTLQQTQQTQVKLSWQLSSGTWRPTLFGVQVPLSELGAELHAAIQRLDRSAWSIDRKLPFDATILRNSVHQALQTASFTCRHHIDLLASFGVECFVDKDGTFEKTDLCMVRAGDAAGQGMTAYGKRIIETIQPKQLQRTLEETWLNSDDQCALRWDPGEDKPYAVQWRNPSKIGALSEKGANCLALFGMVCFSVVPVKGEAQTTGFGLKAAKQSSFTWPIWNRPINLDVVKSLLTWSALQDEQPDRAELTALGIAAAYRCDRIMTSTYYANFTPARRVV